MRGIGQVAGTGTGLACNMGTLAAYRLYSLTACMMVSLLLTV